MLEKRLIAIILIIVVTILGLAACPSTPGVSNSVDLMPFNENITAFQVARAMGAGWNLGNTLEAYSQGNMPTTVSAQETSWGNPVTSREMIELLANSEFRTLRIPITWERFIGPAPNYKIDTAMIDRVQEIVDWAFEFDLYVIINTHHERWNFPSSENEEAVKILTALWTQVGERFAGYSEKLIFESMNEPRMFDTRFEWSGGTPESRGTINIWNQAFIEAIRATGGNNDKRFLLIPTYAASADQKVLDDMWVPRRDNRVMVSVHAYTPYDLALNTRSPRYTFDPGVAEDVREIDALFERLSSQFIYQGRAVVMGEMGMLYKGTSDEGNVENRAAWADYYTGKAAALGIPCLWWDNGIRTTTNNEAFALMNRRDVTWHYPEIVEAMVKNFR